MTGAAFLIQDNPNYYQHLKTTRFQGETKESKQIDKDLNRTFTGDRSFSRLQLKEILISYSIRNPNVGYCQGLNFIVALLLSYGFSEEEAFWMFVQIIEKYLPYEYFTSMSGVVLDQKVFDYLFRIKMPKLCKYMEKLGVESGFFTVQWFICMYSFTFKKEIVKYLWDIIFVHGTNSIYQIGLATLYILKREIMNKKDFLQLMEAVETGCKSITDIEAFTQALGRRNFRIKSVLITKLRNLLEKEVVEEFKERFPELSDPKAVLSKIRCACKDEEECKQKIFVTGSYFTYSLCNVEVIEEFIDANSYPKIAHANDLKTGQETFIVGRKNHNCIFEKYQNELSDDDEEDINFSKRMMTSSVKKSFAQISNMLNPNDLA